MTPPSPALARRLAAYATSAGVALALPAPAYAQVVYHDYDPDLVSPTPPGQYSGYASLPLDFDDDGSYDHRVRNWKRYYHIVGYGDIFCQGFRFLGLEGNRVMKGPQQYGRAYDCEDYACLARLSWGDTVGPTARWAVRAVGVGEYYHKLFGYPVCTGFGNFRNREGYAGFQFVGGDGHLRYGWMRLRGNSAGIATLYEYGYESSPDIPIEAGRKSDAILTGEIDRTTIPAEGDTLVYSYDVSNQTGGSLSLDLWVELGRDRETLHTELLATLEVEPGQSIEGSALVAVAGALVPGLYGMRFRLGDYSQRQFITFQKFRFTKEGNPVAAEPDPDGPGGTHTLSAPAPNPTTGRAEVTLSVAEAQTVTVAVYDALGRRVALLYDGPLAAGTEHRLSFDGAALPAGVYVVRAVGEAFSEARVLSLTR